jgi:hypothetical protein
LNATSRCIGILHGCSAYERINQSTPSSFVTHISAILSLPEQKGTANFGPDLARAACTLAFPQEEAV